MLTNPKIGQRVIIKNHSRLFNDSVGNIFFISTDRITVGITIFKSLQLRVGQQYYFHPRYLMSEILTSEEQDKLNREQHADKYL